MASTTFVDQVTPIVASWLNDINSASYLATARVTAGGTSDAITANFTPSITNLATTQFPVLTVRATAANGTATPTFTPNPGVIAPAVITKLNGQALSPGDIAGAGHWMQLQYDPTSGDWELLNPAAPTSSAVVGSVRNLKASLAAASASVTFTADEIVVVPALGGLGSKIANFNHALNVSTTGIGGMDTGTAPVSGYVSVYAAYNPVTGASGVFACNVTTSSGSVYSGANLPAGYTETGLISVWGTNGSGLLVIGNQFDRVMYTARNTVLSTASLSQSLTSLNIASAVPPNAVAVIGYPIFLSVTGTGTVQLSVSASSSLIANQGVIAYTSATAAGGTEFVIPLITPQTIWYSIFVSGVTAATATLYVTGYQF